MQLEYINKSTFWKIVTINFKSKQYQYTLYSNLETSNWAKQPMLPHTQNFDKTFTVFIYGTRSDYKNTGTIKNNKLFVASPKRVVQP